MGKGGARPGAGAKKKQDKKLTTCIRVSSKERGKIKANGHTVQSLFNHAVATLPTGNKSL